MSYFFEIANSSLSSLKPANIEKLGRAEKIEDATNWVDTLLDMFCCTERKPVKKAMWTLLHPEKDLPAEEVEQAFNLLEGKAKAEYQDCFKRGFNPKTKAIDLVFEPNEAAYEDTLEANIGQRKIVTSIKPSELTEQMEWLEKQLADTEVDHSDAYSALAKMYRGSCSKLLHYEVSDAVKVQSFATIMAQAKPELIDRFEVIKEENGEFTFKYDEARLQFSVKPQQSDQTATQKFIDIQRQENEFHKEQVSHESQLDARIKADMETKMSKQGQLDVETGPLYLRNLKRDVKGNDYWVSSGNTSQQYRLGDSTDDEQKVTTVMELVEKGSYMQEMLSYFATQSITTNSKIWDRDLFVISETGNDNPEDKQAFYVKKQKDGNLLVRAVVEKHSDEENIFCVMKGMNFQRMFSFDASFLITPREVVCLGTVITKQPFETSGIPYGAMTA